MKKVISLLIVCLMVCSIAYAAKWVETDFRKTVTVGGTAVQLSSTASWFTRLTVCAESDNSGAVSIGTSTTIASVGAQRGAILYPQASGVGCMTLECVEHECGDMSAIYINSEIAGDGVSVHQSQAR